MSNLQLRIISALVMLPFVIGAVFMGGFPFLVFTAIIFILAVYEWARLSLKTQNKIGFLVFGMIYLPLCFYEFYNLRTGFSDGLYLVISMLLIIWSADIGAYFVGRKFGKHKMAPTISPNKSWEGLAGAMFFSALMMIVLMMYVFTSDAGPGFLMLAITGAILGYIGQAGDLLESFLKRKAGEKDSSKLIPGHGGVLDRVDSILLVSPVFVFIAEYVL
ncbi:MAG: phosphatidate cytidylyltransferase [Micavibrio aeruginosavorus]|uniref:Phosphatidate cytidylyltransferase n=1 Tax=Micavibrio aeruginosavorus TaxID=349221 RepID=A0A2W5FPS0_9BACT|nr:MAG: phosphatidate cytidylyltransferase [Micavibrio aeruginosavorus]